MGGGTVLKEVEGDTNRDPFEDLGGENNHVGGGGAHIAGVEKADCPPWLGIRCGAVNVLRSGMEGNAGMGNVELEEGMILDT